MIFRKLIIAVAAALCLFASAHAQSALQSSNETNLALEVVFLKGFSAWLVRTRQLYSNWLSHLNAVNISQR